MLGNILDYFSNLAGAFSFDYADFFVGLVHRSDLESQKIF